jgi:polyferredoxin
MEDKEFKNMERQLRETRALTERNNEILQKVHRSMVWSRVLWIFYWVIIVGVAVGAFYFLEPYWDTLVETYESLRAQFGNFTVPQE